MCSICAIKILKIKKIPASSYNSFLIFKSKKYAFAFFFCQKNKFKILYFLTQLEHPSHSIKPFN